jgi:DNA helicase HerA-like ATPase
MRIILKINDEIFLEDNEKEELEIGDNLILQDSEGRGILIQLIEMNIQNQYYNYQQLFLHKPDLEKIISNIPNQFSIENNRIFRFKILKEVNNVDNEINLSDWSGWIPSDITNIKRIEQQRIFDIIKNSRKYSFELGITKSKNQFYIDTYDLQGITLIVGKKGSGKSHVSKIILSDLIDKGCRVIIFDINNEYTDLKYKPAKNATNSPIKSKFFDNIITLTPGRNLKFSLEYVGLDVIYDVLTIPLRLPDASAISFRNIWAYLEKKKYLRVNEFFKAINSENNPHVREALYRRIKQITENNLITDEPAENVNLSELLNKIDKGGAIVINLKASTQIDKTIMVQTILSKIQEMLEKGAEPLWIIAEEAHLYLTKTYWEDIVTRMRHLGAYQIYITNNPQSLPEVITRQTDNIFLFRLLDKQEISNIAPATGLNLDTIAAIARSLPFGKCLTIGDITNNYPFIVKIKPLETIKTGDKRLFLR